MYGYAQTFQFIGLGVGVGREILNFYRGIVQKRGESWPRFNLLMNSVHALVDQEYSGDINIVPSFSWYNPAKLLSHLSEKDLLDLMEGGQRSAYPVVEAIRSCTQISRTMEEILHRFEHGDLRPDSVDYHRPRTSRRRPPPIRADGMRKPEKGKPRARKKTTTVKKGAATSKAVKKKSGRGASKKAA